MDVGRLTCFREGCRDYAKRRKVNEEKYLTFFSTSRWSTTAPMVTFTFESLVGTGNKEENFFGEFDCCRIPLFLYIYMDL